MAYTKQGFVDNETKLTAAHLIKMEDGIIAAQDSASTNSKEIGNIKNSLNTIPIEVIDKIVPPFTESGAVIACHPVEGCPLNITSRIEPIQSGSGDPYPAGSGKNLLPYPYPTKGTNINGITLNYLGDGRVSFKGTANENFAFILHNYVAGMRKELPAGTYTISGNPAANFPIYLCVYDSQTVERETVVYSTMGGSSSTFTINKTMYFGCYAWITSGTVVDTIIAPQLEKGSTPTPYAPYSNIRPIIGHTGCDVTRSGKNLVNATRKGETIGGSVVVTKNENGYYTLNGTAASNAVLVVCEMLLPAGTYTLSHTVESGSTDNTGNAVAQLVAKETNTILAFTRANIQSVTYTLEADTNVTIRLYASSGRTYNNWKIAAQLEKGSTATPYEPYRGTDTYIMDFGKNLLKNTATSKTANGITIVVNSDGSMSLNGTATANTWIDLNKDAGLPTGNYILNGCKNGSANYFLYVELDGTTVAESRTGDAAFTVHDGEKVGVHIVVLSGATISETFYPMIRLASVADSTYVSYNSALLVQTGGMVYGGTYDWNTGVLTVDKVTVTLDGTEVWNHNYGTRPNQVYLLLNNNKPKAYVESYCSHLLASPRGGYDANKQNSVSVSSSAIWVYSSIADTIANFKAYLAAQHAAGTPVQVCYELAEPITVQLAAQEILALGGVNTLYAEAGVVTVNGRIDPEYLNNSILERIAALEAAVLNN